MLLHKGQIMHETNSKATPANILSITDEQMMFRLMKAMAFGIAISFLTTWVLSRRATFLVGHLFIGIFLYAIADDIQGGRG
jgi:hypothetical protein|tara:strand:- start:274 stop:516 length:243 start_codon:yes stop_codon:yes gene_type:complete